MARPIQDTPIITEKEDVKNFRINLCNTLMNKLSPEKEKERQRHLEEMEKKYNLVVKASNGVFY